MLSLPIFAGLIIFASTANAVAIPAVDPYIGDLRTFSHTGCSLENQGVGTFTQSMTNSCNKYAVEFNSIYIHLTPGWAFRAHNSDDCHDDGIIIAETMSGSGHEIVCNNQSSPNWVSYSVRPLDLSGADA